jgi:hypothetical protein
MLNLRELTAAQKMIGDFSPIINKILIIEDEAKIARIIKLELEH